MLALLRNSMEADVSISPCEQCCLKYLTFFVPIEIRYIEELDNVFYKMNYNTPGKQFGMFYNSILSDYSKLDLKLLSWHNILKINYNELAPEIETLSIKLFRLSESILFLQIEFEISDYYRFLFWFIATGTYKKKEVKEKHCTRIYSSSNLLKQEIDKLLSKIEDMCKSIIYAYFEPFLFFDMSYKIPCIKTFFYDRVFESRKYIDFFWKNIGLDDRYPNYYTSDDGNYSLSHDFTQNTIHLFVRNRYVIKKPLYNDIESQIYYTINESIIPSFGPSIAVSEIYNYLYQKYRLIINKKGLFTQIKNAITITDLLRYLYEFSQDSISNDLCVFQEINLYMNSNGEKTTYIGTIKKVLLEKKEIIEAIYKKEIEIMSNNINYMQLVLNTKTQISMFVITILSLFITVIAIIIKS